jgi:hypothetical protein
VCSEFQQQPAPVKKSHGKRKRALLTTEPTAHRTLTGTAVVVLLVARIETFPSVGTPTSACESAEIKTTNIIGRWPIELVLYR